MKIDSSVKSPGRAVGQGSAAKTAAAPAPAPAEVAAGAQVQLSPQATALLNAEAAQAGAPVDMQKVAEIKQAIAEGRFAVNSEKIADGLLDSVRQMLQGRQAH